MAKNNPISVADEEKELQDFIDEVALPDSFDDDVPLDTEQSPEAVVDPAATQNAAAETEVDSFDSEELKEGGEAKAVETPVVPPVDPNAPVVDPNATPAPAEGQTETAVQTPVTPQPETPAPVPPSATPAPTAEEMVTVYNDWRKQSEDLLASHHYNLSQADAEELDLNPQAVIPKLMARVYLDAVSAAIGQVTTHLPRMVRLVTEQETNNAKTENTFWERWPDLKDNQAVVLQIGQAYRQSNPSASMEDFINNVGAMAMVALKKPISSQSPPVAQVPQAPAFVPAAATPQAGAPQQKSPMNIFQQLDAEMFEEDM